MMKKFTLLVAMLLVFLTNGNAQIGVSEGFNASTAMPTGWTNPNFYGVSAAQACGGNSIRKNLYSGATTSVLTTPNFVGASNGTDVTFSFDYKVVNWSAATVATPANFGSCFVELSTDSGTTWITKYTIDATNHIVANTCANVLFTIPSGDVPSGSDLQFRFRNTWTAGDYYFYLDNIAITQETSSAPNCDALLTTPTVDATNASITGNLVWSAATGVATGYNLTVGTSAGGSDILSTTDVGNVTSYGVGALTASTTYYVSIVPYNLNGDATGCTEYSFTTYSAPVNDDCSGAISLTVNPDLTCTDFASGTIQGASASSTSTTSCSGSEDDDVWFSFVATDTRHKIDLTNIAGSTTFIEHSLWTGADCDNLNLVPGTCSTANSSVINNLVIGETYYFRVYSNTTTPDQNTTFDVCVATLPPPITGSTCADPIIVTLPYTTTDNTASYEDTNYEGSPGATGCGTTSSYLGGNNVVYAYTATSDTTIKINLTSTDTWKGMFVYNNCADIGQVCAAGASTSGTGALNIDPFPVVSGQTYYIVLGTWPAPDTMAYTLNITENTCTNATATYTVVSDCVNAPQFFVDVDVTDLGTASSLTISDDQGSATQSTSSTGIVQFGPYPNATPVIFTITNDQDSNCVVTSTSQTQAVCPPDCTTATIIAACEEVTTAAIPAGPGSWNVDTCGFDTPGIEMVYSFTPPVDGPYNLEVLTATGGYVDYYFKEASGSCDALGWTCIDDLSFAAVRSMGTLTAGTEYLILLDSEGTAARTHTFKILCPPTCTDATVAYTIVSNCDVAPQFFVDVNITDLGTATSLTISDNQASAPQAATVAGVIQFGPYPNGTSVVFTVANDQDASCTITSSAQTQAVCPPDCSQATVVECGTETVADFVAGPGAWTFAGAFPGPGTGCNFTTPGVEKMYSFTPATTGVYNIEVTAASTTSYVDYVYKEASGSCDTSGWTCIDDIYQTGVYPIGTLTAGTEYLILLDSEVTTALSQTFKVVCPLVCVEPTATFAVVDNCTVAPGFFVTADITNLGSATSLTVSDNQASATQTVTAAGLVQFGPYALGTPVVLTLTNNQLTTCTLVSASQTQAECPLTCTEPTATFAVVSNCSIAAEFFVTADVTNLGSATTLTVSDNQASATQTVTAAGTVQFGPYANGTSVVLTLTNDQLTTCTLVSAAQTQADCPPSCATLTTPANGATNVAFTTPGVISLAWTAPVTGPAPTNYTIMWGASATTMVSLGTTANTAVNITNVPYNTTFYWSAVPNFTAGSVTGCTVFSFTTAGSPGYCLNGAQWPTATFVPTCSGAAEVILTDGWAGEYSRVTVTSGVDYTFTSSVATDFITIGNAAGTTAIVYGTTPLTWTSDVDGDIRFYTHTSDQCGTQNVDRTRSISCPNLATDTFDNANFTYRPNPVVDVLNLEYNKAITGVAVYNIVGQQVIAKTVNANMSQVDMSSLPSGTYMVKVTSNNEVKTIKVVKE